MDKGDYCEAIDVFRAIDDYKDSNDKITACNYQLAVNLMNDRKYNEAVSAFMALGGYKDSVQKARQSWAATQQEKDAIVLTELESTQDRIFLLSSAEALEYLGAEEIIPEKPQRNPEATASAYIRSQYSPVCWSLRDKGRVINLDGVNCALGAEQAWFIRPAMWITLEE